MSSSLRVAFTLAIVASIVAGTGSVSVAQRPVPVAPKQSGIDGAKTNVPPQVLQITAEEQAAARAGIKITSVEVKGKPVSIVQAGFEQPTEVVVRGTGLSRLNGLGLVPVDGKALVGYPAYMAWIVRDPVGRNVSDTEIRLSFRADFFAPAHEFFVRLNNKGPAAPHAHDDRPLVGESQRPASPRPDGLPKSVDQSMQDRAVKTPTPTREAMSVGLPNFQVQYLDAAVPADGFFSQARPKLVVLLHGAADPPSAPEDPLRGRPRTNTLKHARFYWEFDWVRGLLGASEAELRTFANVAVSKQSYIASAAAEVPKSGETFAGRLEDHFVARATELAGGAPRLAAMLTYRNASIDLMTQTSQAINQVFDLYTKRYPREQQPQIVFVVHSMGGLVGRTLLVNPTEAIAGTSLTPAERRKADYIRNRVLFMVTCATPHQGSVEPDIIQGGKTTVENVTFPSWLGPFFRLANITPPPATANDVIRMFAGGKDIVGDERKNGANKHLTQTFWDGLNGGVLRPERGARTIRLTSLDTGHVPVYMLGGRTPGGGHFNDPTTDWGKVLGALNDPTQFDQAGAQQMASDLAAKRANPRSISTIKLGVFTENRSAYETFGLVLLDLLLVRQSTDSRKWGTATQDTGAALDRVTRLTGDKLASMITLFLVEEEARAIKEMQKPDLQPLALQYFTRVRAVAAARQAASQVADRSAAERQAAKSFLELLGFQIAIDLSAGDLPIYLDRNLKLAWGQNGRVSWAPWTSVNGLADGEIDNDGMVGMDSAMAIKLGFDYTTGGAWYRLHSGPGGTFYPWELTNHGNITTKPAIGAWIHDNLLAPAVGPLPSRTTLSAYPPATNTLPPGAAVRR